MQRDASSPRHYLDSVPEKQRETLELIRAAIFEVMPEVEEGIEHGMLDYRGLANLAAQKHYVSLYVLPAVLDRYRKRFVGVGAGKSCLRFRRPEQLDGGLLRDLLRDVRAARA